MAGRIHRALMALALVAAACGGDGSATSESSTTSTTASTTSVATTSTTTPSTTSAPSTTTTTLSSRDIADVAGPLVSQMQQLVRRGDIDGAYDLLGPEITAYLDLVATVAAHGTRQDLAQSLLSIGVTSVFARWTIAEEDLADLDGRRLLVTLHGAGVLGQTMPALAIALENSVDPDEWKDTDDGYRNFSFLEVLVDHDLTYVDFPLNAFDTTILVTDLSIDETGFDSPLEALLGDDDAVLDLRDGESVWLQFTGIWDEFATAWNNEDWDRVWELSTIDVVNVALARGQNSDENEFAVAVVNDALIGAFARAIEAGDDGARLLEEAARVGLLSGEFPPANELTWHNTYPGNAIEGRIGTRPAGVIQQEKGVWVVAPALIQASIWDLEGVDTSLDQLGMVLSALEVLLGETYDRSLFEGPDEG